MNLTIISQSEFYDQMVNYMIANQDKITDFNNGSALDTQLNAFATQLNQVMVKCSGGFKSQFEQIPFQVFNFQRKGAEYASGTAIFSREIADGNSVIIPLGTVIGTSGGLLYTTQEEGIILSGNLNSNGVNIVSNKQGSAYNVFTGIINKINSSVVGINSVINNTACTGGKDKETNSQYYARFTNFILGLSGSNKYGIFTAVTGVESIQSAYVEDHFPPALGLYNFTVFADDGSGNVPQSKLDEIKLELYGNNTAEYQGYVASGINFRVQSAGLVSIDVACTIKIDPTVTSVTAITYNLNKAITDYIDNLWVGSDVIWSEVNRIVKGLSGIEDVEILTLNGLEENIVTIASQVPRVNSITPTVVS